MRFAPIFVFLMLAALPVVAGEAEDGGQPSATLEPDAGPRPATAPAAGSPTVAPIVAPVAAGKSAKTAGAKKIPVVPAKELFGSVKTAATLQARSIGSYSKGCLAGAEALPVDGPNWQAMRLSRNRNWGHPKLVHLLKRFSDEAWRYDGWPGLLVGDISQPRGGPMLTGHASHQVGLDADVWLTPMPDRRLSTKEREELNATSMLAADDISVDPQVWTTAHVKIIKRAAEYEEVERVLVHPAIKKALCLAADATDRAWLSKVRPFWGHYYHMHIRIGCPPGSSGCTPQKPTLHEDGCGKELTDWIKLVTPRAKPVTPPPPVVAQPAKPSTKPQITLTQLPAECRMVLSAGDPGIPKKLMEAQRKAEEAEAAAQKTAAAATAAAAQKAAAQKASATKATAAMPTDGSSPKLAAKPQGPAQAPAASAPAAAAAQPMPATAKPDPTQPARSAQR